MHIQGNVQQYGPGLKLPHVSQAAGPEQARAALGDKVERKTIRNGVEFKLAPATQYRFHQRGVGNSAITASLPEPSPWGVFEAVGYVAYGSVSWARRISSSTYRTDLEAIMKFLTARGFIRKNLPVVPASERYLQRAEVKRELWWLSTAQVQRLAAYLKQAHESKTTDIAQLTGLIHNALFPGIEFSG
jgi:hypothetical protein